MIVGMTHDCTACGEHYDCDGDCNSAGTCPRCTEERDA